MRVIDLFSGAGGLSLGAQQAGCKLVAAVESDKWAATTYESNFPDVDVHNSDIRNIDAKKFARQKIDLVIGGPPCRAFSTSNQRNRGSKHPDSLLFKEYFRFVELIRPLGLILENVPGILQTENGSFYKQIEIAFRELGYHPSTLIVDASDYGVPQRRRRMFMIGTKVPVNLTPPKPHAQRVSVWEAISDLPKLENGAQHAELAYRRDAASSYAKKLRGKRKKCAGHLVTRNKSDLVNRFKWVPQGGNWESIPDSLWPAESRAKERHTGLYHRLKAGVPSIVVGNYRKNVLLHPTQNRGLSVREAARLQSFPDWFEFSGSIGFQQQQVANAVPPALAKEVISHIYKLLLP
ncbi:DNA cytosine methyltransferase [Luteolibacter rhizosphaerae]|uniref:DNA cytosine methyltransferase n=1 Tax=Luteolibacter rhizosphaerae TaxID=2989719 RepID=UPI0029CAAC02|nr:DNA cytosine methyltransferase [Luteolibacter rhizosphaerae]